MAETEVNQGSRSYSTSRWAYDVFLNFRGADTRAGFTTVLNNALTDRGIRTFFDDDKLPRGQRISSSLFRAIEESRFAIVVFSPNYAASSYCLNELVHITSCCKGDEHRLVLPVFYDVDPSQVRHQLGAYGEALANHQRLHRVEEEKLRKWTEALYEAANLSGWHIQSGSKSEYTFIRKIIGEISRKINRTFIPIGNDHLVGMDSRARNLMKKLRLDSDEGVFMVGIWGLGGGGKTTLARVVYNLISGQFEATCFLADVRRRSHEHGLVKIQEALLSEIFEDKDIRFENVTEIIPILKHRLHRKKVLLILDDVEELKQLESLAGGPDWFGPGSRIIVTTRDKHLLHVHGVAVYKVEYLKTEESIELLCLKAFEDNKPDPVYMELSDHVVRYSHGCPLSLEIIGSYLFGKQIGDWHSLLCKYRGMRSLEEGWGIILRSYHGLDADVKKIFLDIACCFNGYELEYVKDVLLNARGIHLDYGLQVLISKSFIKIDGGRVRMHDLVHELGREIVRRESPTDPGQRSRLWYYQDILDVLQNNEGTDMIELMKIDLPKGEELQWDGKAFKNMTNLIILEIVNSRFSCVPTHFPERLRVLNCKGYFS